MRFSTLTFSPLVSTTVILDPVRSVNFSGSYTAPGEYVEFTTDANGDITNSILPAVYKVKVGSNPDFYISKTETGYSVISSSVVTGSKTNVYFNLIKHDRNTWATEVVLTPENTIPVDFSGSVICLDSVSQVVANGTTTFANVVSGIYRVDCYGTTEKETFFIAVPNTGGTVNANTLEVVKPAKALVVRLDNADKTMVLSVSASDARYVAQGGSITNAVSASYALTASYAVNGGGGGTSLTTGSTYPITASVAVSASRAASAVTSDYQYIGTTSANSPYYPMFSSSPVAGNSNVYVDSDSALTYNPSTNVLAVPTLQGTASQAVSASQARSASWAATPTLDQIGNPTTAKTFQMTSNPLVFTFTNPVGADGAFEIEGNGNFSGDLVHIHQHTGNPNNETDLLHLESTYTGVTPLRINGASSSAIVANGAIEINLGSSASPFKLNSNAKNVVTNLWAETASYAVTASRAITAGTATSATSATNATNATALSIGAGTTTTEKYNLLVITASHSSGNVSVQYPANSYLQFTQPDGQLIVPQLRANGITASLLVGTASNAISASWAPSTGTGGGLSTGSTYPFTSSWATNVVNGSTATYTSSLYGTASWATNVVNGTSATYTSSLYGTASWANNAVTASSLYGSACMVTASQPDVALDWFDSGSYGRIVFKQNGIERAAFQTLGTAFDQKYSTAGRSNGLEFYNQYGNVMFFIGGAERFRFGSSSLSSSVAIVAPSVTSSLCGTASRAVSAATANTATTATNADGVYVYDGTANTDNQPLLFTTFDNVFPGYCDVKKGPVTYKPSTNTIKATNFEGTSSWATNVVNGSTVTSVPSASWASSSISASRAVSAASATNADNVYVTGNNLNVDYPVLFAGGVDSQYGLLADDGGITFTPATNTLTVANINGSASYAISASYAPGGTAATYTSSLYGTSSWATNVVNGSTVTSVPSSSWASSSLSASYATTASYALTVAPTKHSEALQVQSAKLPITNSARLDASQDNWELLYAKGQSATWQFPVPDEYQSGLYSRIFFYTKQDQTGIVSCSFTASMKIAAPYAGTTFSGSAFVVSSSIFHTFNSAQSASWVRDVTFWLTGSALTTGSMILLNISRSLTDNVAGDIAMVGHTLGYMG